MAECGEYRMLEIDDAVKRSCEALKVFRSHGVECIRIGLCASDNLGDDSCVMGGANHPSLGELVMGEEYFDRMTASADMLIRERKDTGGELMFTVPTGEMSKAVGQRGRNRKRLQEKYKNYKISIKEANVPDLVSSIEKH